MYCQEFREKAVDYLKDYLSDSEKSKLKEHLGYCRECSDYLKECKNLIEYYPDYEKKFNFPEKLNENIKKSIEDLEKIPLL